MTEVADVDAATAPLLEKVTLVVAHLTDPHVKVAGRAYPRTPAPWLEAPNAGLERALDEVHALARRPDVIVLTGDLTEQDELDEYRLLGELLARCELPVLLVPGNHDRRSRPAHPDGRFREGYEVLRSAAGGGSWPDHPDAASWSFSRELGGFRIVGIDTSRCESHSMSLEDRETVERLLGEAAPARTILLTHSPLLPVGNFVDALSFHDGPFLERLVRHGHVRAVLSGHAHRDRAWRLGSAVHVTSTSLSYGIGSPVGWTLLGLGDDGVRFVGRRRLAFPRRQHRDPDATPLEAAFDLDEAVTWAPNEGGP